MIRRTQHKKRMDVMSFNDKYSKKKHIELHLITTYWFLFIPIYINKKFIDSNL